MRSAMRTVEKRCDTSTVIAAVVGAVCRCGPRRRSARTARARSRRRARPSARRARAAAARSRMNPRASASFCHWPNDTSTPSSHVGPSCVSSPRARRSTTSSAPARVDRGLDRGPVVEPLEVADADGVRARRARSGRSPGTRRPAGRATRPAGMPREVDAVDGDRALRRLRRTGTAASRASSCPRRSRRRSRRPRRPAGRASTSSSTSRRCPGSGTTRARAGCRRRGGPAPADRRARRAAAA